MLPDTFIKLQVISVIMQATKVRMEIMNAVAHNPKNPSYFDRTPVINLIIFNSSNFFFHLASNFYNYKVFILSLIHI